MNGANVCKLVLVPEVDIVSLFILAYLPGRWTVVVLVVSYKLTTEMVS